MNLLKFLSSPIRNRAYPTPLKPITLNPLDCLLSNSIELRLHLLLFPLRQSLPRASSQQTFLKLRKMQKNKMNWITRSNTRQKLVPMNYPTSLLPVSSTPSDSTTLLRFNLSLSQVTSLKVTAMRAFTRLEISPSIDKGWITLRLEAREMIHVKLSITWYVETSFVAYFLD